MFLQPLLLGHIIAEGILRNETAAAAAAARGDEEVDEAAAQPPDRNRRSAEENQIHDSATLHIRHEVVRPERRKHRDLLLHVGFLREVLDHHLVERRPRTADLGALLEFVEDLLSRNRERSDLRRSLLRSTREL